MSALTISWLGATALALVTASLGYAFGVRQERDKERRARNFTSAAELVAPLRELQRLLRWFGREDVEKDELTSAFLDFSRAVDAHGHRLPHHWGHVSRSVRDAAGTVFGGVSLAHLRPDVRKLDLGTPDPMWQDFADDYLEYTTRCVLEWGDASSATPKVLMTYETWLVRTGRRKPFGQNCPHLAAPSEPAA
jgi:hypothetical protein